MTRCLTDLKLRAIQGLARATRFNQKMYRYKSHSRIKCGLYCRRLIKTDVSDNNFFASTQCIVCMFIVFVRIPRKEKREMEEQKIREMRARSRRSQTGAPAILTLTR